MVVGTVVQGKGHHQRQQTEVKNDGPRSPALDTVGKGAEIGDCQEHRVPKGGRAIEYGGKEDEIHRRMAV